MHCKIKVMGTRPLKKKLSSVKLGNENKGLSLQSVPQTLCLQLILSFPAGHTVCKADSH